MLAGLRRLQSHENQLTSTLGFDDDAFINTQQNSINTTFVCSECDKLSKYEGCFL